MVCLGNICRSPLAEGILKEKAKKAGLNWEIDSAGTSGYHDGEAPDPRSITTAQQHGIDISQQRSRQLRISDLDDFDWVYVMDSSNYNNVLSICETDEQRNKVVLIMNMTTPKHNIAVPDPYWDDNGFEQVYQMLDRACDGIMATIRAS